MLADKHDGKHGKNNKKFHRVWVVLTVIPVIATAIMIFCFSAQNGEESSKTSGKVVQKVVEIVKPDIRELPEEEQEAWIVKLQHRVRKTAHFLEYTMFGFFLMLHLKVREKRHAGLWALGMGAAYAGTDEIHQLLIGSRSGRFTDVLLDSSGVLTGIGILILVWYAGRCIYRKTLREDAHSRV